MLLQRRNKMQQGMDKELWGGRGRRGGMDANVIRGFIRAF